MAGIDGEQAVLALSSSEIADVVAGPLAHARHFCGDPEGWGPVSSIRYGLTPCFLDVFICFVAVFGLVGSAGALWLLLRHRTAENIPRNWHFYAKLVRAREFDDDVLNIIANMLIVINMGSCYSCWTPGVSTNRKPPACLGQ